MIDLYYWTTPNGHKMTMFLEEAGMPHTIHPVNIGKGDQFKPEFLKISPNNRIPAIVDRAPADGGEPIAMFESGAILLYLADKIGRFVPRDTRGRLDCIQWLFWQMANLGPLAGQNHHFVHYAPAKIPYAIDRYVNETGASTRCSTSVLPIENSSPAKHHRRHGEPSLGAARAAEPEHGRLSASETLEGSDQGAPGDASGLRQSQGNQSGDRRNSDRGREEDPFRADQGRRPLIRARKPESDVLVALESTVR
jgi:hypothetical protein